MDKTQFEKVAVMVRLAASVESQCDNLKKRLKLAASELKAEKDFKPVADAGALLLKQVESAHAEIGKVLKIGEKDVLKSEVADYKKKAEKMKGLVGTTSDAAAAYLLVFRNTRRANPKVGACTSALASHEYSEMLIKYATDFKIAFNQMK